MLLYRTLALAGTGSVVGAAIGLLSVMAILGPGTLFSTSLGALAVSALIKERQADGRPLAQGDGECFLHCILGDVDVAEDADQGSHRSAGLFAEDPADLGLVELG